VFDGQRCTIVSAGDVGAGLSTPPILLVAFPLYEEQRAFVGRSRWNARKIASTGVRGFGGGRPSRKVQEACLVVRVGPNIGRAIAHPVSHYTCIKCNYDYQELLPRDAVVAFVLNAGGFLHARSCYRVQPADSVGRLVQGKKTRRRTFKGSQGSARVTSARRAARISAAGAVRSPARRGSLRFSIAVWGRSEILIRLRSGRPAGRGRTAVIHHPPSTTSLSPNSLGENNCDRTTSSPAQRSDKGSAPSLTRRGLRPPRCCRHSGGRAQAGARSHPGVDRMEDGDVHQSQPSYPAASEAAEASLAALWPCGEVRWCGFPAFTVRNCPKGAQHGRCRSAPHRPTCHAGARGGGKGRCRPLRRTGVKPAARSVPTPGATSAGRDRPSPGLVRARERGPGVRPGLPDTTEVARSGGHFSCVAYVHAIHRGRWI